MAKFEDKDFGFEDIEMTKETNKGVKSVPKQKKTTNPFDEIMDFLNNDVDKQPSKSVDIFNKRWIAVPQINDDGIFRMKTREVDQCSSKDFCEWVEYLWPASKGHHKEDDYIDVNVRNAVHDHIIESYRHLKFPNVDLASRDKKEKK